MADPNQPEGAGHHDSHSIAGEGPSHGSPPPGPYGPQDFFQHMASVFQNTIPVPVHRSVIERLSKHRPVDFLGKKDEDPTAAEMWLERMERVFKQMHCTPTECLECIISLLQEDAYTWWTAISETLPAAQITWDFFKEEFKKKYIGRIYLDQMRRDFMYLRQRQLTVIEYEREFIRLSRYGRGMIATEAEKCRKFEDGLSDYIRFQITALQIEDFTRLVTAALNVERVRNEEQARKSRGIQKRGVGQVSSNPTFSKKQKVTGSQMSGRSFTPRSGQGNKASQTTTSVASTPDGVSHFTNKICEHCGKKHSGECWLKMGACLKCGSMDHFFRNCPKYVPLGNQSSGSTRVPENQSRKSGVGTSQRTIPKGAAAPAIPPDRGAPARTYAVKTREDVDDTEVIIGDKGKNIEGSETTK